jgi:hypothetical protein
MSSGSAATLVRGQRPRVHLAPSAASPDVDDALFLADRYGLVLEPWQRLVLSDWLARSGGRYASLRCGLAVPRQNGKNAIIEVRELFGMVELGERILHTAHEVKTARKAFKRLRHFFGEKVDDPAARFPELNALVTEIRSVNGQEAIVLSNGGSVEIVARSKGSGRGFTVDALILDEAQDLADEDLEALLPTTSSAPLGNPQWIFTGTPPGPKVAGDVFQRQRETALLGAGRHCWHEWSLEAEDLADVDLNDRDLWAEHNPALAGGRLQLEVAEGERQTMDDEGFARERLGWWRPGAASAVVSPALWSSLHDPTSTALDPVVFAVAVTPMQDAASISISGRRSDGLAHLEVVDSRPGTGWVVDRLSELVAKWRPAAVVLDGSGPAGSLLPSLSERGVEVTKASMSDYAQACGAFYDAAVNRQVRHLSQLEFDKAVAAGRKRPLSDRWAWGRKGSADITPLEAATLALWALPAHRTYDVLESIG